MQYAAVKALTFNATACNVRGLLDEKSVLERIATADPEHPGYKHCLHLKNSFTAFSFHGPHTCLLTEPLGTSVKMLRMVLPKKVIPVWTVKRIIRQLLLALDYLHTKCDVIHMGTYASHTFLLSLLSS